MEVIGQIEVVVMRQSFGNVLVIKSFKTIWMMWKSGKMAYKKGCKYTENDPKNGHLR